MLISVRIEDGAMIRRYTARVSIVGFMRLCRYDELERESPRHQWRVARLWDESDGLKSSHDDGIQRISRPALPASVKAKLLVAAKAQIEWAKEE